MSNRSRVARGSDAARIARKFRAMDPQYRQMRAIRRAIKHHQAPPTVTFGVGKPPVGKF